MKRMIWIGSSLIILLGAGLIGFFLILPAHALKRAEDGRLASVHWEARAVPALLEKKIYRRLDELGPDAAGQRANLLDMLTELRYLKLRTVTGSRLLSQTTIALTDPDDKLIRAFEEGYRHTSHPEHRNAILRGTYGLDFNTRRLVLDRLFPLSDGENRLLILIEMESLWQIATTPPPAYSDSTWQDVSLENRQTTQAHMEKSLREWLPPLLSEALSGVDPEADLAWTEKAEWLLQEISTHTPTP